MGKTSPTQRTLAHEKKQGHVVAIVERFNHYTKTRADLYGFADLLVLRPVEVLAKGLPGTTPIPWKTGDIVAVQVTSGSNVAARVTKILAEPRARTFLQCGGKIEAHGWRKLKVKRGGKAVRWELRVVPVTLADFEEPVCPTSPF